MKAWVLDKDAGCIKLADRNVELEEHGIWVDVLASALNRRDLWILKGQYPNIVDGVTLGSDACVRYEGQDYIVNPSIHWGENDQYQSADYQIVGLPTHGTLAQKFRTTLDRLHPKPAHLSVEEAAALPLAGVTAYRAIVRNGRLSEDSKVLISGIGGGVAMMAFQYALAIGAEVYVTSSSDVKIDRAIALGAKGGVNYTKESWAKELLDTSGGVDIVIDSAGGPGFKHFVDLCNMGGRICFFGGTVGVIDGLNPRKMFWRQLHIYASTMGSDADFEKMIEFVNTYKVHPIMDEVFNFDDVPEAFEKMNRGDQMGKIVIKQHV